MSLQDRISLIHCVPRELVSKDSTPPLNKPKHPPYQRTKKENIIENSNTTGYLNQLMC